MLHETRPSLAVPLGALLTWHFAATHTLLSCFTDSVRFTRFRTYQDIEQLMVQHVTLLAIIESAAKVEECLL